MTVQEIINRARRLAFTAVGQYPDTYAIQDFNLVYKNLCNEIITQVNENFFYDYLRTNLTNGQNEFVLDSTVKKVESLWLNYGEGYVKATEVAKSDVMKNDEEMNEESNSFPKFYIADNSLFIFPALKAGEADIIDGVKLDCILEATDLLITDASLLIDEAYHYIIAQGMLSYIFQQRGKLQEKNDAIREFEGMKSDLILQLSDRNSSPTDGLLPNLSHYA